MCTMYVQGSLEIRGTCWNPRDGVIYSILLGEQVSISSIEEKACVFFFLTILVSLMLICKHLTLVSFCRGYPIEIKFYSLVP